MNQKHNPTGRHSAFPMILRAAMFGIVPLLLLSCFPGGALPRGEAPSEGLTEAANVRAADVVIGDIDERVRLSGEVYATGRVNVMPETGGLLTKVLVNPGDPVSADQIIAYVDPSRPGMSYAESPVKSTTSGTVTAVPAIAGNQVSAQSVIAEVGNLDRLEVEAKVPEKYLAALENGLPAGITSRAYPDVEIPARVNEVSPVVDPRSRTVLVTLRPDPTDKLRPGQAVTVDLVLETRNQVITIPASTVTERRDGLGVFVVDGDTARWHSVALGANYAGMVEVTDGLETGSTVITTGLKELTDGSPIRVLSD